MNFYFDCNSTCALYLLTCRICIKQYTASTIARFGEQFNLKEGEISNKKLLEHFYSHDHHGTHNMIVQITDFCGPNDQEKQENFCMHNLRTLYPDGLNHRKINQ